MKRTAALFLLTACLAPVALGGALAEAQRPLDRKAPACADVAKGEIARKADAKVDCTATGSIDAPVAPGRERDLYPSAPVNMGGGVQF